MTIAFYNMRRIHPRSIPSKTQNRIILPTEYRYDTDNFIEPLQFIMQELQNCTLTISKVKLLNLRVRVQIFLFIFFPRDLLRPKRKKRERIENNKFTLNGALFAGLKLTQMNKQGKCVGRVLPEFPNYVRRW